MGSPSNRGNGAHRKCARAGDDRGAVAAGPRALALPRGASRFRSAGTPGDERDGAAGRRRGRCAETTAERLRDLGYRVLETSDGPSALSILQNGPQVDLLITDVGLPRGMNGRQVAEAVRERSPGVPILFITGYATTKLPTGAAVISKPFEFDDLAKRAQTMMAAGRKRHKRG
jgi:CheY-like chemotaxis protein